MQGAEHPALAGVRSLARPLVTLLEALGCFESGPAVGEVEVSAWGARGAPSFLSSGWRRRQQFAFWRLLSALQGLKEWGRWVGISASEISGVLDG